MKKFAIIAGCITFGLAVISVVLAPTPVVTVSLCVAAVCLFLVCLV